MNGTGSDDRDVDFGQGKQSVVDCVYHHWVRFPRDRGGLGSSNRTCRIFHQSPREASQFLVMLPNVNRGSERIASLMNYIQMRLSNMETEGARTANLQDHIQANSALAEKVAQRGWVPQSWGHCGCMGRF